MSLGRLPLGGGRFATVVSEIGRGGMGAVFRAVTGEGATVAVKVLLNTNNALSLARFEREQRLLAGFSEAEGFVPLLEAGETQLSEKSLLGARSAIVLFIVMPFLPGGTLRRRIDAGPMAVEDVVELALALATALGYAHERGVVHRDLKPENVLFSLEGHPLVADLGLAKHFDREAEGASLGASLSQTGQVRGTVGYMPPEQMVDSRSVGPEADVYALGVMLHECLAGRGPFPGETAIERLLAAQGGRFDRLHRVRPGTPPWLAQVIERCLDPSPERRFADARSLLEALEARRVRRSPVVVPLLTLVVVAAVVGGAVVLRASHGRGPARSTGTSIAPVASSAVEIAVERARVLIEKHDAHAALPLLDRALEGAPTHAPAWSARARVKGLLHDFDGAIADATRAIALDPRDHVSFSTRGAAHHARGDLKEALADLDHAIALDPTFARALTNRSTLRRKLGDIAGADADEARAAQLDPKAPALWFDRGVIHQNAGQDDDALDCYNRAIAADPTVGGPYNNRSEIFLKRGDIRAAQQDVEKACELDPHEVRFMTNRAQFKGKLKDPEGARADFERAVRIDPTYAPAWRGLAEARRQIQDTPGEIDALTHVIDADPQDAESYFLRAEALVRTRDLTAALADLDRCVARKPMNGKYVFKRGSVRNSAGDRKGAEADYTRVIELEPTQAGAFANRATVRTKLEDRKGAAADLERFLELSPGHPEAAAIRQEIERLRTPG